MFALSSDKLRVYIYCLFLTIGMMFVIFLLSFLSLSKSIEIPCKDNTVFKVLDLNDTVEITCPITGVPKKCLINWIKITEDGEDIVYPSSDLHNKNRSVNFNYDRINWTYTMRIRGVDETDEGLYKCEASDVVNKYSNCGSFKLLSKVEIKVLRPPVIQENSSTFLEVYQKQDAYLECTATGYPTPIVYWKRENNTRLPTGGSIFPGGVLNMKSVKKEDAGTYICVATNTIGVEAKRPVTVKVNDGAPIHSWDA